MGYERKGEVRDESKVFYLNNQKAQSAINLGGKTMDCVHFLGEDQFSMYIWGDYTRRVQFPFILLYNASLQCDSATPAIKR